MEEIECTICFDLTSEYSILEECGHYFCNICWRENLHVQIGEGRTIDIHCMHQGCKTLVPDHIIKRIVSQDVWKRYSTFISKNFVENSKTVRWCPAIGCNKALYDAIIEGNNFVGICSCGKKICWSCSKEYHSPATCTHLEQWDNKSNSDEIKTKLWLQQNTKKCPCCKNAIEKNEGCFMMTCKVCHFSFCWLCCAPWFTHTDHFKCSKYKDGQLQNKPEFNGLDRNDYIKKKSDLIFTHYMNRYNDYKNARSFEIGVKDRIQEIINYLIEREENHMKNFDFIMEAFEQLKLCRELMQNLCMALAVEKTKTRRNQYDNMQSSLEFITEKLGTKLERDFSIGYITIQNWDKEIKNLGKIASQTTSNILSGEVV